MIDFIKGIWREFCDDVHAFVNLFRRDYKKQKEINYD